MNTDKNIQALLHKYRQMCEEGRSVYLDSDEFVKLFDYYYHSSDEPTDAEKHILEVGLQMHPTCLALIARKVKLLVDDERYTEALALAEQSFGGYDLDLHMLKITCDLFLGYTQEAYILTQEVLHDDDMPLPKADILADLGAIYLEAGYNKEAKTYLEKSIQIEPTEDALIDLAHLSRIQGEYEQAIKYVNQLLDSHPYNLNFWLDLAVDYAQIFQYDKAIEAIDYALSIESDNTTAIELRAYYLSLTDRYAEALEWAHKNAQVSTNTSLAYSIWVSVQMQLEQYSDALNILQQWAQKEPNSGEMVAKTAELWLRVGQITKAERYIESIFDQVDNPDPLWQIKGEIMFLKRQYLLAEGFFWFAIESKTNNTLSYDRLSTIYIAERRYTEALQMLQQIIDTTESQQMQNIAYFRQACIFLETKDTERFIHLGRSLKKEQLREVVALFMQDTILGINQLNHETLQQLFATIIERYQLFQNLKY